MVGFGKANGTLLVTGSAMEGSYLRHLQEDKMAAMTPLAWPAVTPESSLANALNVSLR